MATIVNCPTCKTPIAWTPENQWRPFCSERCKQIDLGAWAEEKYVIATKPDDTEDEPDNSQH